MSNINTPRPISFGRILLNVLSVNSDGKTCRVKDAGGFEFDVPIHPPVFLPFTPGETIALTPGMTISCEIAQGTQRQIADVFVEAGLGVDTLTERPEFTSSQPEGLSWTPGIATGSGFEKQ